MEESPPADPYASLASNIPATCPGTTVTTLSGNTSSNGSTVCAVNTDLKLTGNTTINSNQTIIIYNGNLNLNGFSLTTSGTGVGGTIIFTGSNTSAGHTFTGFGSLNIAAPTSGTWSGIAVYQNPSMPDTSGNLDVGLSGNDTFQITGVLYQPKASDTFKGAIDKATNGYSCFVWVFNSLQINGTADVFDNGEPGTQAQCTQAGVTQIHSHTFVHALIG